MSLSARTYLGFAAPGFFMALTAIPTYITLQKFYVDHVGLAAGSVGLVLGASRVLDALTDPLIGWISDQTRSPLGRRKPYLILGGLLCGLSLWPLLQPAGDVGALYLFTWISIFYLGAALIQVPYTAWTADLTKDYAARTRLAGFGQLALLAGTLVALGAPQFADTAERELRVLAVLALIAIPLTLGPAIFWVQERAQGPLAPGLSHRGAPFDALRLPFADSRIRRFALAYALNALGNTLPLTLTLFYFAHVLQIDPGAPLLLYFLAAMACIPLWTYVGNRLGRGRAWQGAILISTLAQVPALFLGPETWPLFFASALVTGACLGAEFTLPQAMQADLADEDRQRTGKDRAATHYALWSVTINLATALGAGLALTFIDAAGFQAGLAAHAQVPSATAAIALGYAVLPALFKLPALALLQGFERNTSGPSAETLALYRRHS